MNPTSHIPVMTSQAIEFLHVKPGGRYLDGTLGGGGHTAEILRRSSPDGKVLSLDVDPQAIARFKRSLDSRRSLGMTSARWKGAEINFRDLGKIAQREKMTPLDGILLDLGFSSDQMADPTNGLSFNVEGPLDMRLWRSTELTAADIVNAWRERELADLIRTYGEERFAHRIARAIVTARKRAKIVTTTQLADIVAAAVPSNYERGRIHPATRTFQALRITVNDELNALRDAISGAHDVLAPRGRLVIISFHSLEDRIVKRAFKEKAQWNTLTKKPLVPTEHDMKENPRARSAKLRAAETI